MEDIELPKPYDMKGSPASTLPSQSHIILPVYHDHNHILQCLTGDYRAHIYEKDGRLWVSLTPMKFPCGSQRQYQYMNQSKRSLPQLYQAKHDEDVLAVIKRLLDTEDLPHMA
jgi:hypothetical protein